MILNDGAVIYDVVMTTIVIGIITAETICMDNATH